MTEIRIEQLTTSIESVDENDQRFAELFARHMARYRREQEDQARARRIADDERDLRSVVDRQREPWGRGSTDD